MPGLLLEGVGYGLERSEVPFGKIIVKVVHAASKIRLIADYGIQRKPLETLQDGGNGAVRHLQALDYAGHGAILEKVGLGRILHGYIRLRDAGDEHIVLLRILYKMYGLIPAYGDREDGPGEEYGVAEGQYGKYVREGGFIHLLHAFPLHHRDDADLGSGGKCIFFISHKCQNVSAGTRCPFTQI